MIDSIRCLRDAAVALLSKEDADEATPYFDYIIQAMS
jgi:allophycocyanin-B